ncbi:hypothetical protein VCRA2133E348_20158 [Vibrio crassostreae]|nr:hypothetical protein VCRA2119O48_60160 [Vibrio crassostreae]CAK2862180.1 hypothetical protein VCRA2133E348_20158 [Vibrio crassostreae]CAK3417799.1 hypothetical protein VCRA213O314_30003 [Vibrio crassostreae]CAK3992437.1 hypothetical protein VCRA212O16_50014 [Vibrio crassostreae]
MPDVWILSVKLFECISNNIKYLNEFTVLNMVFNMHYKIVFINDYSLYFFQKL